MSEFDQASMMGMGLLSMNTRMPSLALTANVARRFGLQAGHEAARHGAPSTSLNNSAVRATGRCWRAVKDGPR
ncbi:MAG: hypothetical protein ACRDV9_15300, partial [Acidimicrobiia bacterium]